MMSLNCNREANGEFDGALHRFFLHYMCKALTHLNSWHGFLFSIHNASVSIIALPYPAITIPSPLFIPVIFQPSN